MYIYNGLWSKTQIQKIDKTTSPPPAPDMSVADGLFLCNDPALNNRQ